jgi:RNA polymerase sigma-70 factor (ECF subfamily)
MPPGRGGNGVRTPWDDGTAGAVVGSLYERYAARIQRVCVDRLGDRDDAADAVQDTFLRAWLALRNGVEVRHPLPWLLTIADNVCVSRVRAQGARVATAPLSDAASVDFPEAVGEVAGLTDAFRALPLRQREALLRRELQGYSYDEIGAELGVSRASVAALLHRARLTVADTLREARRGIAAIVPIPAVLRAPFESGAAASGAAVAGTAVVAMTQLAGAGPVPSSPQPPARTTEAISMTAPPSGRVPVAVTRAGRHAGRRAPLAHDATTVNPTPSPETRSGAPRSAAVGVLGATSIAPGRPTSANIPLELPAETAGSDTAATPQEPGGQIPTAAAPETPAPPTTDDEQAAAPTTTPSPKPRPHGSGTPPGKQPRGTRGRSEHAPGHAEKPTPAPTETAAAEAAQSSSEPDDKGPKPREDAQPGPPGASPAGTPPGKAEDHPGQGTGQGQSKKPEKVSGPDGKAEETKTGGQGKAGRPPAVPGP